MTQTSQVRTGGSFLNMSPDQTIKAVFIVQSIAAGGMYVRIADFQQAAGLDEAELGLALLGQPLGALVMMIISSRIVEAFGTKWALVVSIPLLALSPLLLSVAQDGVTLFLGFALFGLTFAIGNVAMNVEADRVEAAIERRIMNTCHGLWSLAFLATSLLAAWARGVGMSPLMHFGLFVPFALIVTFIIVFPMRVSPPRQHNSTAKKKVFAVPTLMTFLLVGFVVGGVLMEGSTRAWSVIYMRDSFDLPAWLESMTIPAFLLTMTVGRLMADKWIDRYGPKRVALVLISIALVGVVAVTFAQNLWLALLGFALIGFGVCVSFPMSLSAAARLGDRPSSENVAAVTVTTNLILLGSPALLGLVAENWGIRMVFGSLIPFLILSLFLARFLAPQDEAQD